MKTVSRTSLSFVMLFAILFSSCTLSGGESGIATPKPALPPSSADIPASPKPTVPGPTMSPAPTTASSKPSEPLSPTSIGTVKFDDDGYTKYGDWHADVSFTPQAWQPGAELKVSVTLQVAQSHLEALEKANIKADGFVALITAERTFDSEGWMRLAGDERMSTLLTPAGLPIEGGVQGAVTNRFGYGFRTPVDELKTRPMTETTVSSGERTATFHVTTKLPDNLPPGIYRLRLDFGVTVKNRYLSLNGETFTYRPFPKGRPTESYLYSPPLRASGNNVHGRWVDAGTIKPRIPWVLLANYNSNGYRGLVADEDRSHFALSDRNIIHDEVILPLYDERGNVMTYFLGPQFPMDTIDPRAVLPYDTSKGEIVLQVTGPDGKTVETRLSPFLTRFGFALNWRPPSYGKYTVKATGWVTDKWGNRYEGGGTYHFWIAKRLTMATATFQGMPYPVGARYGRDIAFAPAVPADVEVSASLFVNSDPANVRSISYSGKASPGGVFGAAQGMKPFVLDAPGEYYARILATYTDPSGDLWVCSMSHAGVVYSDDSPIVARGKKLTIGGKLVDRGETKTEGYYEADNVTAHLAHVNYPYQAGDVLLIASDQMGADKIEPVLTYETKDKPAPYDPRLQTIGATNLKLQTSNGYSPHMFPEFITDWAYYYGAAPRPGFMARFLIGEDGVRAPYWPTSATNVGGQIGASNNGDMPGEIYRLIGGVVLRKKGQTSAYAGYIASCSILPRGTNNNRVVSAGQEDLLGSTGEKARFFLVGLRPGMIYDLGAGFTPAVQVDPLLPANITFRLRYPDGREVVGEGTADQFGTFAGKDRWTLDKPGVYRYYLDGNWQGNKGFMPGLPKDGGEFYVIDSSKPGGATGIKLNLPTESRFAPNKELVITGSSGADSVRFAAITPGAVLAQGTVPVEDGKFEYHFSPADMNRRAPVYDIVNLRTGQPEIKDVVHLTLYAEEVTAQGKVYHTAVRVILHSNTVIYIP